MMTRKKLDLLNKVSLYFSIFAFLFALSVAFFSCGDDSTNNIITNPPVTQDSTVKLVSPSNGTSYNNDDSFYISWSKITNVTNYQIEFASDTLFSFPYSFIISDTTYFMSGPFNCITPPCIRYYHVRIYNPVQPTLYWSETRHFVIQ